MPEQKQTDATWNGRKPPLKVREQWYREARQGMGRANRHGRLSVGFRLDLLYAHQRGRRAADPLAHPPAANCRLRRSRQA